MVLNNSGVHDTSRVLKISKGTVISELTSKINPYFIDNSENDSFEKLEV